MAKIEVRVNDGSREFEFEGKKEDVASLMNDLGLIEQNLSTEPVEQTEEGSSKIEDWPSTSEVKNYIEEKDEFRFSVKGVSEYFFGRRISCSNERKDYNRLYERIRRAKKKLENEYDGKFKSKRVSEKIENGNKPYKEYWFVSKSEEKLSG